MNTATNRRFAVKTRGFGARARAVWGARGNLVGWCLLAALVSALGGMGCASTGSYEIVGSHQAVGVDGSIFVELTRTGNRKVVVSMEHLPLPERIDPSVSTYAVWFVPNNDYPVKAGTLAFDPISREGRLIATTPFKEFVVRLTAEPSNHVNQPSEHVVAERYIVH